MRDQDYIHEGCEEHAGEFGGRVGSFVYVPELSKADPAPRLWSGWEYPGEGSMGEDHLSPAERKAWETDIAWCTFWDRQEVDESVYDSKFDWMFGEPMWLPL
jgi:hypothetical protein